MQNPTTQDPQGLDAREPWGLSRATPPLLAEGLVYATLTIDPATQLTNYLDPRGAKIDMGNKGTSRTYPTVTYSRPGDGAKNAPSVPDNTNTDQASD